MMNSATPARASSSINIIISDHKEDTRFSRSTEPAYSNEAYHSDAESDVRSAREEARGEDRSPRGADIATAQAKGLVPPDAGLKCQGCGNAFNGRPRYCCSDCSKSVCPRCIVFPMNGSVVQMVATCAACVFKLDLKKRPQGCDHSKEQCTHCKAKFQFLFRRRHWCRCCGDTICEDCSATKLSVLTRNNPHCICKRCYVPAVFKLSQEVLITIMQFLDIQEQDKCIRICRRFQLCVLLPFPWIQTVSSLFTIGSKLGTGGYGTVYKCKLIGTEVDYAVKLIAKRKIFSMRAWRRLIREVVLHTKVHHPHAIKLFGVMQTPSDVALVLELSSGGDLLSVMRKAARKKISFKMNLSTAAAFAKQMLYFLDYSHEKLRIVHRDIKPDNILLSQDYGIVKMADFGLAKVIPASTSSAGLSPRDAPKQNTEVDLNSINELPINRALNLSMDCSTFTKEFLISPSSNTSFFGESKFAAHSQGGAQKQSAADYFLQVDASESFDSSPEAQRRVQCTPCGTLKYCAPEVITPSRYVTRPFAEDVFKRDVFSVGVVVYLIVSSELPYPGATLKDLQVQMRQPLSFRSSVWESVDERCKEFLQFVCAIEPGSRPTARQALTHPWISGSAACIPTPPRKERRKRRNST